MSITDSSTSSSGLPEDIWGEIAEHLSAFDIFSLSQACRELHSFLSRRDVWIRVLRLVCCRRGVFLPTYPASEMTVEQLQRAASRPERWRDLVRRRAAPFGLWDEHPPTRRRDQDEHPTIMPTLEGAFFPLRHWRLHLVPGGRFLSVLTIPDRRSDYPVGTTTVILSIYDLGEPGSTYPQVASLVASQSFSIACTMSLFAPTAKSEVVITSESSFRVVVVHPIGLYPMESPSQWSTLGHKIIAFDVEFRADGGSHPSLKKHGSSVTIDTPGGRVLNIYLQGHRVLLRFIELVVIWDAERMLYICIKVPDLNAKHQYRIPSRMSVLTSHQLFYIGVETLRVWDISLLGWIDGGPSPQIDASSAPAVPPDMIISDPWNHKPLDQIKFFQVPCPADTDHTVYFDVHYCPAGHASVTRYRLDVTPRSLGDLAAPPTAIAEPEPRLSLTPISATRLPTRSFFTKSNLAHGQLFYMWGDFEGVRSYAYAPSMSPSIPSTTPETMVEETAMTAYVWLGSYAPHSFCALSGRMICTEDGDNVKVIDYLL